MKFTNKAEIFQLESDDKFLSILACDEYLESKLKLETIINDNKTLMEELELLHKRDESSVKSSNDLDHEINLEKETLAKLEKQKQSFENDLREEKKIYKEEMLKIQEEDKLTARKIQQLHTEAENIRMEELQGQQAFAASKVQWHQKFEEELEKLNKLKGKESPTNSSPTNFLQESVSTLKSRPPSQHEKVRTSSISSKRKSISSSSARSGKQIKLNTPFIESGLDEPDTDEENVSSLINYQHSFLILSYFQDFNITFNTDTEL